MSPLSFIPQANPQASFLEQEKAYLSGLSRVLKKGHYILGPEVAAFEREFAHAMDMPFAIGVATGTDALELSLRSFGIGPGDLVFTVSHTAVATVAAILRAGATPVLVDICPQTFTMAPKSLEAAIDQYQKSPMGVPKAVIPVHLYGHPANLPDILPIARKHSLVLIEDCAQAHGAQINGRFVGSFGDLGAFSFYPTKNLGAFGDAGAIVTKDPKKQEELKALRQYGWMEKFQSSFSGVNSRLDEIQACILRIALRQLPSGNQQRRKIAFRYLREIHHPSIVLPMEKWENCHVFHQFVIQTRDRDHLAAHLQSLGIGTGIHYPMPVHQQKAFRSSGMVLLPEKGLKVTEEAGKRILSLPMYPQLKVSQVSRVIRGVNSWPMLATTRNDSSTFL